jgi:hypothetical protein
MKRNLGFDRLRLRGLKSAADEFLLVAAAQNGDWRDWQAYTHK